MNEMGVDGERVGMGGVSKCDVKVGFGGEVCEIRKNMVGIAVEDGMMMMGEMKRKKRLW